MDKSNFKYYKNPVNSISGDEYLLFRDYIMSHSGIVVPPEKSYLIETRLSRLMAETGTDSFSEFYRYAVSGADRSLPQKIVNAITTNETLWFRDGTPWKIMEEVLLPKYVDEILSGRRTRVRIWFSAVSTGQEAYSTAMCVDNYLTLNNIKGVGLSHFDFFATDISSRVLDIAKKGRYDSISIMRGLDDYYRFRYFFRDISVWDIDPKIRGAVKFAHFNLLNSYQMFGLFDIIFCRYVLIYFSDAQKKEIISRMGGALHGGGVLFTGNYALYDLFSDDFKATHYENLTYYTKK